MARLAPLLCFSLLVLLTAVTGLVHGRITNRWGKRPNAQVATDRLKVTLPADVGSWHMQDEQKLSPEALRILQEPSYINRSYVHQQTGDQVRMFVLVGHPGPVAVHTPEVCYTSRDYSINAPRTKTTVKSAGGTSHEFWELPLQARNGLHGEPLRVFYAWSTGTTWQAAESPRFSYGGLPHLYKIQIAVTVNPGSKAKGFDPATDFLQHFIDQLQPRLVEATRPSGSSS